MIQIVVISNNSNSLIYVQFMKIMFIVLYIIIIYNFFFALHVFNHDNI